MLYFSISFLTKPAAESARRTSTTTSRSLFLLSPLNEEGSETKNDRIETGREALGYLLFPIRGSIRGPDGGKERETGKENGKGGSQKSSRR